VLSSLLRHAPESLKDPLRRQVWQRLGLDWTLRSGLTVQVRSHADWFIYNEIFVNGEYDVPLQKLLDAPRPGEPLTICDLGANVGYFTLRAYDLLIQRGVPPSLLSAHVVEGAPQLFAELKQRLQTQPAQLSIKPHHGLVGKKHGHANITETHRHFANTVQESADGGSVVPYLDLSTIMRSDARIDLLKCDIEGSEQEFIANYPDILARTDRAVFEFHTALCDIPKCIAMLAQVGLVHQTPIRAEGNFPFIYFER